MHADTPPWRAAERPAPAAPPARRDACADDAFVAALRAALDASGLAVDAVADLVGHTPQTVGSWLRGDTRPFRGPLAALEQVLGVPDGQLARLRGQLWDRPDDELPALASLLYRWRREAGLPVDAAAGRLGIGPSTLSRWERGLLVPRWTRLPQIAEATGIPLQQLKQACPLPDLDEADPPTPFAAALVALRRRVRCSRAEVAAAAGVDVGVVRMWERGESVPAEALVLQLEAQLGGGPGTLAGPYGRTVDRVGDGRRFAAAARLLRQARLERGLTRDDLAAALGVAVRTVRAWEQGQDGPPSVRQARIVRHLGLCAAQAEQLAAAVEQGRAGGHRWSDAGRRAVRARRARGWSREQAAQKLGVHVNTLRHLEHGRHRPDTQLRGAWVALLGPTDPWA